MGLIMDNFNPHPCLLMAIVIFFATLSCCQYTNFNNYAGADHQTGTDPLNRNHYQARPTQFAMVAFHDQSSLKHDEHQLSKPNGRLEHQRQLFSDTSEARAQSSHERNQRLYKPTQAMMPANEGNHFHPSNVDSTNWDSVVSAARDGNQMNIESRLQKHTVKEHRHLASEVSSTTESIGSFLSSGSLELALRQASGDESVFQPASTINTPGHSLREWLNEPVAPKAFPVANPVSSLMPDLTSSKTTPAIVTTSVAPTASSGVHISPASRDSTAELNNIVLNHDGGVIIDSADTILNGQQSMTREYPTNSGLAQNASSMDNAGSSLDFNNQVIYEGPATAPPVRDSYYFSATEKDRASNSYDSKEGTASNAWWAIGIGQEFERASNLTRDNYLDYCDKSPFLTNNKQRSLCRLHPKIMAVVARGLRLAIDECQTRFVSSRWNCSLVLDYSLGGDSWTSAAVNKPSPQIFGEVMRSPNRERSYLNAIIAAGLAQAMTKACSAGELPEECSCDKKIRSRNNKGRIEWIACSDDIDYGARFSRDFTDNLDLNESDATATIYLHNNEVGRRVFKSTTDITCTCQNGENGMCQTKRCWKHLSSFTDIGDELMRRYESATHVQRSSKDPHKLRPVRRGVRRPKRKDLVYIAESPDYCQADSRLGLLGTQNRRCNSTSTGSDSCSLLCCGRGYQVVLEEIEEDCNCKFVWCCQVKCDKCKRHISNDICN